VHRFGERLRNPPLLLRLGLVVFVLAWLFGPALLRSTVPVWLAFLIALGLELQFFIAALGPQRLSRRPDRGPLEVDRERYGYAEDPSELLLVREAGEELWIPYSGETDEEFDALVEEARERPEWEPPQPEPAGFLPAPLRRFLVGLAVIGALALLLWAAERNSGWNGLPTDARAAATKRFSAEASRVAGKPVTIRCDEAGTRVGAVQHSDGVAIVGGDLAYLTPERCYDLHRLAFDGEIRSSRTGRALAVLAHEAWHLRGVRDEGTTECYGLQTGVDLGRSLGLSPDRARQLMRQQLTENLRHRGSSLEYLVPSECRDGGRLDLDPRSSRFP
jgi:hypothetical protein